MRVVDRPSGCDHSIDEQIVARQVLEVDIADSLAQILQPLCKPGEPLVTALIQSPADSRDESGGKNWACNGNVTEGNLRCALGYLATGALAGRRGLHALQRYSEPASQVMTSASVARASKLRSNRAVEVGLPAPVAGRASVGPWQGGRGLASVRLPAGAGSSGR